MVNDRGSIKWTSLMLPEHVELLKSIWSEDKKVAKPMLDDQELEILNRQVIEAYRNKEFIQVEYYRKNQMYEVKGIIGELDTLNHIIKLKELDGECICISFMDIVDVSHY